MDEDRDFIGGFCIGTFITLVMFTAVWLISGEPRKTSDGKFYLKTHGQVYQLVSDQPVKIKEVIQ